MMKRAAICLASAFGMLSSAYAEDLPPELRTVLSNLHDCAGKVSSVDKGECLAQVWKDSEGVLSAYLPAPASGSQTAGADAGAWNIIHGTSDMDGSKTVMATLEAIDGAGGMFLFCQENQTLFGVRLGEKLFSTNIIMELGTGSGKPLSLKWEVYGDYRFAAGNYGSESITAAKRMASAEKAVIRLTPRVGDVQTYRFETKGAGEALKQVGQVCGWTP